MRIHARVIAHIVVFSALTAPIASQRAAADESQKTLKRQPSETHLQFARRLRSARAYEQALSVLKAMKTMKDLPVEAAEQIPLEEALNLHSWSLAIGDSEARKKRQEAAFERFVGFLKKHPAHPRAGEALSARGRILIAQVDAALNSTAHTFNRKKRDEIRKQAREKIAKARADFRSAEKLAGKRFKSFPLYIPPERKAQLEARMKVELELAQAQLDVANCSYHHAHTFARKSQQRKDAFKTAGEEFGKSHSRYRARLVFIVPRLMVGICHLERGNIGDAQKVFEEILSLRSEHPSMIPIRSGALHHRLICLNHNSRKNYRTVEKLAEDWLRANKSQHQTRAGNGIRYQLAVAQEKLADTTRDGKYKQTAFYKAALANARLVAKRSTLYHRVALTMIARIQKLVTEEKPKTFEGAYTRAQLQHSIWAMVREQLRAAKIAKTTTGELEGQEKEQIDRTAAAFEAALKLAVANSQKDLVVRARYYLAYALVSLPSRNKQAFELGMKVARQWRSRNPQGAQDAAFVALVAAESIKANNADIQTAANFLISNWPNGKHSKLAKQVLERLRK